MNRAIIFLLTSLILFYTSILGFAASCSDECKNIGYSDGICGSSFDCSSGYVLKSSDKTACPSGTYCCCEKIESKIIFAPNCNSFIDCESCTQAGCFWCEGLFGLFKSCMQECNFVSCLLGSCKKQGDCFGTTTTIPLHKDCNTLYKESNGLIFLYDINDDGIIDEYEKNSAIDKYIELGNIIKQSEMSSLIAFSLKGCRYNTLTTCTNIVLNNYKLLKEYDINNDKILSEGETTRLIQDWRSGIITHEKLGFVLRGSYSGNKDKKNIFYLISPQIYPFPKPPCGDYGNICKDEMIDSCGCDTTKAELFAFGLERPTPDEFKRADVDLNGVIDLRDVCWIHLYSSQMIHTLPACIEESNKCGNLRCEEGEDRENCPTDCRSVCGFSGGDTCFNGVCEIDDFLVCPLDCLFPSCGNGICDWGEQFFCPKDCGGGGSTTSTLFQNETIPTTFTIPITFTIPTTFTIPNTIPTTSIPSVTTIPSGTSTTIFIQCTSHSDCKNLICPQIEGRDTPCCNLSTGKCYCGNKLCTTNLTTSTTTTIQGTCAGRCGRYDPSYPCQCDSECRQNNDCCNDICITCPNMPWCQASTTTIPRQQGFSGSNFVCEKMINGHTCKINYNNYLGENAIVVFLFTNERYEVVSSSTSIANQGSGSTYGLLYCSSVKPGKYLVFWKAYRESDSKLANEVAWSKSYEVQTIIC